MVTIRLFIIFSFAGSMALMVSSGRAASSNHESEMEFLSNTLEMNFRSIQRFHEDYTVTTSLTDAEYEVVRERMARAAGPINSQTHLTMTPKEFTSYVTLEYKGHKLSVAKYIKPGQIEKTGEDVSAISITEHAAWDGIMEYRWLNPTNRNEILSLNVTSRRVETDFQTLKSSYFESYYLFGESLVELLHHGRASISKIQHESDSQVYVVDVANKPTNGTVKHVRLFLDSHYGFLPTRRLSYLSGSEHAPDGSFEKPAEDTSFSDFQQIAGCWWARKIEGKFYHTPQTVPFLTVDTVVESIEINGDIPDENFMVRTAGPVSMWNDDLGVGSELEGYDSSKQHKSPTHSLSNPAIDDTGIK